MRVRGSRLGHRALCAQLLLHVPHLVGVRVRVHVHVPHLVGVRVRVHVPHLVGVRVRVGVRTTPKP